MLLAPLCLVALPQLTRVTSAGPAVEPDGSRFGRAVLVLEDLDDDGVPEIAVGAPNAPGGGAVLVLSGATRALLLEWQPRAEDMRFGHELRPAGDVNGDGITDALVGFERLPLIEVRSGKDGALLHRIGERASAVLAFGDLDGDGADDLFLGRGKIWEVLSGKSGDTLRQGSWVKGNTLLAPAGDLDGDGLIDVVLLGRTKEVALTGTEPAVGLFGSKADGAVRGRSLAPLFADRPAGSRLHDAWPGGDLDGDGTPDVLLLVSHQGRRTLMGAALGEAPTPLFEIAPKTSTNALEDVGYAAVAGADLDGDDRDDVVYGPPIGTPFTVEIAARGSSASEILWSPSWSSGGAASGVALALHPDADGDGVQDVLVGSSDWFRHGVVARNGTVRLLSGATGKAIWTVSEYKYRDRLHRAKGR